MAPNSSTASVADCASVEVAKPQSKVCFANSSRPILNSLSRFYQIYNNNNNNIYSGSSTHRKTDLKIFKLFLIKPQLKTRA